MKRLPAVLAFVIFLALCASLAYWLLQWLAPPARPVAAPPVAQGRPPPLSSAAHLFGGSAQGAALASVQLRGVIRSGRAGDSVAIIAAEGKPARALHVDGEVLPGVLVKEIHARTVVLSEKGAERELTLPAFAAQSGGAAETTVSTSAPAMGVQQGSPGVAPQSPVAQGVGAATAVAAVPSGTGSGAAGGAATGNTGAGNSATGAGSEAPASGVPVPRPEMRPEGAQRR